MVDMFLLWDDEAVLMTKLETIDHVLAPQNYEPYEMNTCTYNIPAFRTNWQLLQHLIAM
jgi:hypothetical protein